MSAHSTHPSSFSRGPGQMDVTMEAPSPNSSNGSDMELPDAFGPPPAENKKQASSSPVLHAMDLDSRITSFLAGGNQPGLVSVKTIKPTKQQYWTVLFFYPFQSSFLSSPIKESHHHHSADSRKTSESVPAPPVADVAGYPFYPGADSPFGDLTSLLVAPPPPPPPIPPPPPPLLPIPRLAPPPIFSDLPRPDPPPRPPASLLGPGPLTHHQQPHPAPRVPSWGELAHQPPSNGGNDVAKISSLHASPYSFSQDVDLRCALIVYFELRQVSFFFLITKLDPTFDIKFGRKHGCHWLRFVTYIVKHKVKSAW